MYEVAMKWLYDLLYSSDALTAILAENVENPTRELEDGTEAKRAALYDTNEPVNSAMPYVVITPSFQPRSGVPYFGLQNITLTFDVYTSDTSSLTAVSVAEIITSTLEFTREGVQNNIYRTFTNQDLLTVPDEERPEIGHVTFTAQLRYIREDYLNLGGY